MSNISLIRFLKNNDRKRRTLAIWYLTAFYRAQMLMIPSKKLQKNWGESGKESPETDLTVNYRYAYVVARDVSRIADHTPWESKCLVRALTARYLLHRKGIKTTLYLGVGKDEITNLGEVSREDLSFREEDSETNMSFKDILEKFKGEIKK